MQQFKLISISIGVVAIVAGCFATFGLTSLLTAVIAVSLLFFFAVDTSEQPVYNQLLIGYTAVLVFAAITLITLRVGVNPLLSFAFALISVLVVATVSFVAHAQFLNHRLFVPPHTRITIVGPYGKREHRGTARVRPVSTLLKEVLMFAIKETEHRCQVPLMNVNTYHPAQRRSNVGKTSGWRTGPPGLDYDLSESSIHTIHSEVIFTPLPNAAFARFNIAGYETFRKQVFQRLSNVHQLKINELADAYREVFNLAIEEKLDEIVREMLIVRRSVTPADVRNEPHVYAEIAQAKLALWAEECGLKINRVEFRSVQLVDPVVEQQYRHMQVAAYSKAQEIQMLNAALANTVALTIEQTLSQLEAQGVHLTAQMVATIAQDAMREAFLINQRQRVQLASTVQRPTNITSIETDQVIPFRKAS